MRKLTTYRMDVKLSKAIEKEAKQKKVTQIAVLERILRNYFHIFNEY